MWCEAMETESKEAKKIGRNVKAALSRCEKKLTSLLDVERPEGEVSVASIFVEQGCF